MELEEKCNMKATGIVRRIDELGRIVVPKEIRRTMRIREGDPMEIYTSEEGTILLKKYSPVGELSGISVQIAESMNHCGGNIAVITDRDRVIAVSGGKRDIVDKSISDELNKIISERKVIKDNHAYIPITEEDEGEGAQIISPVICNGDVIGSAILVGKDKRTLFNEGDSKMVIAVSMVLGKQMEN